MSALTPSTESKEIIPYQTADISKNQDDEEEEEEPSMLKILVEKEKDIKQAVALLKGGIAVASVGRPSKNGSAGSANTKQFEGLNNLLNDNGVKSVINTIAGSNTQKLIDSALSDINSKNSVDDKQTALAKGIKKIHSNLKAGSMSNPNDPRLALALKMLGINKDKLI